jgi:4a-hydroxytetrahydrobiopterin dehydratase
MRPNLLSEDDIEFRLKDLPLWERKDIVIFREISASNFAAAVGIINAIAVLAETADHHPDLLIYGWNKVRITLSTHDRGGLTELDFALAKKIEDLKF